MRIASLHCGKFPLQRTRNRSSQRLAISWTRGGSSRKQSPFDLRRWCFFSPSIPIETNLSDPHASWTMRLVPSRFPSAEAVLDVSLRHLIPDQGFLAAHHCRSTLRTRAWRNPESAEMPGRVGTADQYFRVRSLRDRVLAHDHVEQLLANLAENRGRGGSHAAVSAARHLRLIAAGLAPELIQHPQLNLPVLLSPKHRIARALQEAVKSGEENQRPALSL